LLFYYVGVVLDYIINCQHWLTNCGEHPGWRMVHCLHWQYCGCGDFKGRFLLSLLI